MFSKEEAKERRQLFWTMFGKRYQRKWMLYDTKMKDVVLKFDFEDKRAIVALDLTHDDAFYRAYYFEKLESLKSLMKEEVSQYLIFDPHYTTVSGNEIARIYISLDGVKIQKQTDWPMVYEFFHTYMDRLEEFFKTYKDLIDA
ncbi:DUF4268 domain-containing protein [Nonlabens xiamenensis]|uniref:DUF4268 domain-containing protein n=1 Tax=Nonlabens xiamenensis TaxID=2341043 RepID=UPI000F60D61A|nr:DUF4268 domain-containing protein [Nonlabens xiamenensis]